MILKTQLFIVLIVAPAKKLWPWQNSEGGFGIDLVWLSAENYNVCSRIDVVALLLVNPLLNVSDICRWCVMEADLYSNFEDFCGRLVASQNFLAHQHQADGKLTFYGRNDWISSCFELLNRHFLPPWTQIFRFRSCRVVSSCTKLGFGARFSD